MRIFALLGTPWCLLILLSLIVILFIVAAMSQRRARRESSHDPWESRDDRGESSIHRRPSPLPAASAPLEGLTAIHERLTELARHLPPDSEDARWLRGYTHDLGSVTDELYDAIDGAESRPELLERLGAEVARLDRAVSTQIEARLSHATDRNELRAALDRLRHTIAER